MRLLITILSRLLMIAIKLAGKRSQFWWCCGSGGHETVDSEKLDVIYITFSQQYKGKPIDYHKCTGE